MSSPAKYTQQDIDAALIAYWLEGNSVNRASETTGVPSGTISNWVTRHAARLDELRERHAQDFDKAIFRRQEAIQLNALDTIAELVEQTGQLARERRLKNPDQAAQRLATVMGIVTDKWLVLQGRPNQITDTADASEILKRLKARFDWLVVDSTAEEEPQRELPE